MQERLPDTPWHVGYALKDESDSRRHRSRCIYYDNKTKYCTTAQSPYIGQRCGGSAHCNAYAEKKTEEVERKEKEFKNIVKNSVKKVPLKVVCMDDKVEIKNLQNGDARKYRMVKVLDKPTEFTRLCLGHSVGYTFESDGIRYKIMCINDGSKANETTNKKQVEKNLCNVSRMLYGKYLTFKVVGYDGKLPKDIKKHNTCIYSVMVKDGNKKKRIPATLDQDTDTIYVMRNVFKKYKKYFQS